MSCFIMTARALATLARGIDTALNCGYNVTGFNAPDSLYYALDGCRDKWNGYDERKIFAALHDLNARAYAGRYREETPEPCPPWPGDLLEDLEHPERPTEPAHLLTRSTWAGGYWNPAPGMWQYLKLLDCYAYQTAEDATYRDPLHLAIKDFARALAVFLARNCAAYDAAGWGDV